MIIAKTNTQDYYIKNSQAENLKIEDLKSFTILEYFNNFKFFSKFKKTLFI